MLVNLLKTIADTSANVVCPGTNSAGSCSTGLPKIGAGSTELHQALQITFGILAAIAVLFVVIGGVRFVVSEGNSENVAKARETVVYAVIGLVISMISEGIVTFVLNKF